MKNTVILFHPKTNHERNYRYYWIPYATLSLAAPLVDAGYQVVLWDNNVMCMTTVEEYRELLSGVIEDAICVGVSSMIGHQLRDGLTFSEAVRELREDVPLIWGGPLPTILPDLTLSSHLIDVAVNGQGEVILLNLVQRMQRGEDWRDVLGISYRNGQGETVHNFPMKLADKNGFPPYPWHLVDLSVYVKGDEHVNSRILNYVSSQGCPYDCSFCSDPAMYSQKWTALKPQRVLDEISYLVHRYGLNGIKFYDSTFFANPARTKEFARLLTESGLGIKWAASAHPRLIKTMSGDVLQGIAESGLSRLLVGLESGVQRELDLVGKGVTVDDLYLVAEKLSQVNVRGAFTFIVGFPGATEEEIDTTLRFGESLRALDPRHEVKAHIYAPFPGTAMYTMAVAQGYVPPDTLEGWSYCDYYEAQTPWLPTGTGEKVRQFNEAHCPYVL